MSHYITKDILLRELFKVVESIPFDMQAVNKINNIRNIHGPRLVMGYSDVP
jgi:hypothetical protein